MCKGIDQLTGHILICGFGRVGQVLASDLAEVKQPFVVIDASESRVAEAQAAGYLALLGNASEDRTLEAAGIARAQAMAAVLSDDSANVFVTLTARDLNPTIQIIARAESPSTERKLMRSGANRVVLPAFIGATKIAQMIVHPSADDFLQEATGKTHLNEDLRQIGLELIGIEVKPGSPLVGRKVGNVEASGQGGFVVVAITRADGSLLRAPEPGVLLKPGDVLVILGHHEALPELANSAKPLAKATYRGVTA